MAYEPSGVILGRRWLFLSVYRDHRLSLAIGSLFCHLEFRCIPGWWVPTKNNTLRRWLPVVSSRSYLTSDLKINSLLLNPPKLISSRLSPLTLTVVGAPQMTLQQYLSIYPCLPLPSGNIITQFLSIPISSSSLAIANLVYYITWNFVAFLVGECQRKTTC